MLAQGYNQTLYLAELGKNHGAGVIHVISVADAENIAAAIKIAHRGGVLRAHYPNRTSAPRRGLFALNLHGVSFERNE